MPETFHNKKQIANNRAELSHQSTGVRERGMRIFKSMAEVQQFLTTHAAVYNFFNLQRHLVRAEHYRVLRDSVFACWENVTVR